MKLSRLSSMLPAGVRRAFRLPLTRGRMLNEMDDEVRSHIEMRSAELRGRGLTNSEASAEAVRRFGDVNEFRAYAARRAARRAIWRRLSESLEGWTQDIRFAGRQLRKNAAFAALAVLTLALGIGANTAIFTVVHRLLLAPLPYPDGNRIVTLVIEGDDHSRKSVSRAAVEAWRARAHSIESIASVTVDAILVQDLAEQDTIAAYISSNYLRMLGLRPALGRAFTADEIPPRRAAVAMITYGLWQRAYGGRADVLGSTVQVEGRQHTIVGVTPPDMGIPMAFLNAGATLHEATPSIWLPQPANAIGNHVFARLRPGVSAERASKELQAILDSVAPHPGARQPTRATQGCCARALRAQDLLDPREARAVEVLFVAVGVLLLIACANVANLLMLRAWTRRREFAVRIALGAGRARLARLVLTESVALALAGGLLGIAIAWEMLRVIVALRPPALANLADVHVETAVLFWSAGISVVTGIIFGSVPALFAGTRQVGDVLRSETRAGSSDRVSKRIRALLIVAEIAMSLVLLVSAGLLVRSFAALLSTPLGFDPHDLIAADALLPNRKALSGEARPAMERAILERVRALPGVTDAAIGTMPSDPYGAFGPGPLLETDPDASGQSRGVSSFGVTFMTANYFRVVRMRLIEGRLPDSTRWGRFPSPGTIDDGAPPVEIVVSQQTARRLFPDGHVLGARLHTSGNPGDRKESYVVVGVVGDVRMPGRPVKEANIYRMPVPIQVPLVARVSGSAQDVATELRRAIAAVDPRIIRYTVVVGDDYLRDALAPTRFSMTLLLAFSIVALVLAAVGLYGAITYSVSQRTREIGVRVALGANANSIARLVTGDGLRLALVGAAIGAIASIATTRALTSMLYGVTPSDPATFCTIGALILSVALIASYLPARRASRIDPIEALRAE